MVYTTENGLQKPPHEDGITDPVVLKMAPIEVSLHMGKEQGTYNPNGSANSLNGLGSYDPQFSFSENPGGPSVPFQERAKNWFRSLLTLDTIKSKLPIIEWLPKYNMFNFQCDLIAGITVGLTLIPQSLAYAGIAGLAPQYGLYSAFICVFIYCVMGSSKDITLGPSAIVSLITASFATSVSPRLPNGEADPTMAIVLAFTTGLIQIFMSFFKLGIIVSFISFPVINAFSSAAAITIAVSQLKTLLGVKGVPNDFVESLDVIRKKLPYINVWDMTMGMSCIVVVILLKKLREIRWKDDPDKPIPIYVMIYRKLIFICGAGSTAIVVIVAAGILAILERYGVKDLTPTGYIRPGMPEIRAPRFDITIGNYTMPSSEMFSKISAGIIVIPIIALMEAMAIGKYFARVNQYKLDPAQELLSYGIGNLVTSFFQGYAVTGTFSRTAINSQCGVKTPLGNIFTGVIVIISLYFLTPLFYYIPKCALAGVIIAAVLAMVDIQSFKMLYRANKVDVVPYFVTFAATLLIGIQWGIFVGMGVSILILLYPIARPKVLFSTVQGFMIVTPTHGLDFPGAEYLEIKALDRALQVEKPHNIILNMEHLSNMDYSAIQSLRSLLSGCELHGMKLILAQGQKRVKKQLKVANIKNAIIVDTVDEAIKTFRSQPETGEHDFKCFTLFSYLAETNEEKNDEEDEGFFISRL
ncbi:sodium-independent sulfate anion transporter-like isoform X1 [Biomphalaria glabrata]|uniref:Sodium-independent sulfate anion transporter-like isoform X1 n=3 Tax=Biomphalaria glabrata TaxID=6526 RepID=A0A9W2ZQP0_BIOGL|nr:sodium-independent sulfate anion transporter-like isoform X1 [Biomphalaria glabrata]